MPYSQRLAGKKRSHHLGRGIWINEQEDVGLLSHDGGKGKCVWIHVGISFYTLAGSLVGHGNKSYLRRV